MKILLVVFLISLLLSHVDAECEVTAHITKYDCFHWCAQTYGGERSFYNINTTKCEERVSCQDDEHRDWVNNLCMDPEWQGHIYDQGSRRFASNNNDWTFYSANIVHGASRGGEIICDIGWKSSGTVEKVSENVYFQQYCDLELQDGQIYPMQHGEYYFNKLDIQGQILALNRVHGQDSILTIRLFAFCCVSLLYIFLNLYECHFRVTKALKRTCCFKSCFKNQNKMSKQQEEELQRFLAERQRNLDQQFEKDMRIKFSIRQELKRKKERIQALKRQKEQKKKQIYLQKAQKRIQALRIKDEAQKKAKQERKRTQLKANDEKILPRSQKDRSMQNKDKIHQRKVQFEKKNCSPLKPPNIQSKKESSEKRKRKADKSNRGIKLAKKG